MNMRVPLAKIFPFLDNEKARVEWVKSQLKKIPSGESIIDAGAGECRYKKYCKHLKYKSQDFGEYKGKGDARGLQTEKWNTSEIDILSDITQIPVKRSSFDNVLCTEVLEHVPYPDLAIKEISRILKKRGRLILTAPFCSQTHFSPHFYSTGFSVNWYKEVLVKYGLKIIKMDPNGNYFEYLSQELVRFPFIFKKYSGFVLLSFLFYMFTIPLSLAVYLFSFLTENSEEHLCFGWHILAIKK